MLAKRSNCLLLDRELHYLPPYSPDFNPIEMAFSSLKSFLRRPPLGPKTILRAIARGIDAFTPAQCQNYFAAVGYMTATERKMLQNGLSKQRIEELICPGIKVVHSLRGRLSPAKLRHPLAIGSMALPAASNKISGRCARVAHSGCSASSAGPPACCRLSATASGSMAAKRGDGCMGATSRLVTAPVRSPPHTSSAVPARIRSACGCRS